MPFRSLLLCLLLAPPLLAQPAPPTRPFGTLREQAARQQRWLEQRLTTVLPGLMRKHGVAMWVIPMREYNEDPVFTSLVSPTTFAARRRTIYVFFDKCAATAAPAPAGGAPPNVDASCVERIALGGTSQGGLYTAARSTRAVTGGVPGRQAELWGDEQWLALEDVIEARNPRTIGINVSRVFAFSDGLSAGELDGMSEALGAKWTSRFKRTEALPLELIATRVADEEAFFTELTKLVHQLIGRMFSSEVIRPGVTRTSDLVWWWRQQVNDLGLGTWFQPSVSVQRQGVSAEQLGEDPVIQRGDMLHCDVGITAMRLNTDTQHNAYVLRDGETAAPAGLEKALANSNRFQDILMEEVRPGRTGNEVLHASLARLQASGITGTMYSHPVGMHGHGAGPLIGLWDMQTGVPGRGDAKIIANMWYSSELQTTTPVPEWGGQPVRMAQEEDFFVTPTGNRWAYQRQSRLHLVK
ncbi:MAG TPA: M24 family metallopeptidase [Gemmatimonadaceae bacterium]|jgi:hypothetical protein|nr:M24 family metallopeptidase [Gemmatimonadaceae bacterium]